MTQELFKRQKAGADIEPGVLIINAALGRSSTVTVTAILDTQLKINLPPTLDVGTGDGRPVSAGTAGNRDRNGLGAGKGPPSQLGTRSEAKQSPFLGAVWAPWHL